MLLANLKRKQRETGGGSQRSTTEEREKNQTFPHGPGISDNTKHHTTANTANILPMNVTQILT